MFMWWTINLVVPGLRGDSIVKMTLKDFAPQMRIDELDEFE